jgi:hydroxymethylbilane synthase
MTTLRIGTRGSKLALIQSNLVAEALVAAHVGLEIEMVTITTHGDADQSSALSAGEGQGWFTSAIQEALGKAEIDLAVHSYKDLPTKRPPGLMIAAVPEREDPRDALVSASGSSLRGLPGGAVIGTSSPRREAQVRELRPDLAMKPIRGNVDTRIAKVDAGDYDATVLALAGLRRMGLEHRASHVFGFEELLPAPAQGALAVECRVTDRETRDLLAAIDHPETRAAVTAERSFLAAIDAGCSFPAGAYAEQFGTTLKLHALVANNGRIVRSKMAGPVGTAAGLGRTLAEELMTLSGLRGED